jgi:hypothetical protein
MLWTVRYLLQFDAQRKPAGPRLPDKSIDFFVGATTVDEAISDDTLEHLGHFDFVEEFPTYAPVTCFGYPPRQQEALFGDSIDPRSVVQ